MGRSSVRCGAVVLVQREEELGALERRAAEALAGRGSVVVVSGEAGAGKTSFVEAFASSCAVPVLWGACDPLSTPRPLGPVHDLADRLGPDAQRALAAAEQSHEIYAAVFERLAAEPVVLVVDDLHWADQGTVDLLRYVLRRIRTTRSLVVGALRGDELAPTHPLRSLLGDVARSPDATTLALPPLTLDSVVTLVGDRGVDPAWLHERTAGNPFFVVEMLDHRGDDLPTTVRDAILARTVMLEPAAWDLLNLLVCSPEAIPDRLLPALGVPVTALQALDRANLIRRRPRSVAFRHDLCRLAIATAIPPGAEPHLHRRMIDALRSSPPVDPAVLTHHALGASDDALVLQAASDAGRAAARSGAHTQATAFFRIALDHGGHLDAVTRAELLERLADECYLVDQLDDAIAACEEARRIREHMGAAGALSADHHSLSIYEWYNANRRDAEQHAVTAVAVLDGEAAGQTDALVELGHALAMQAYLALYNSELDAARPLAARAAEVAARAADPGLTARTGLIQAYCDLIGGAEEGRDAIVDILRIRPEQYDEIYSSGFSNLSYLDVEHRRFREAAKTLERSITMSIERDLPVCRVWQIGTRGRLALLTGAWDHAVDDADDVLRRPSAPLARTWPLLTRALVTMRRDGNGHDDLDAAWELASRYGEPMRLLPAAAGVVERAWLTGAADARLDECRSLLERTPRVGLEWARGDLAAWLRRLDPEIVADGVSEPYRLLLDGRFEDAAASFEQLSTPYDAALALLDSGDAQHARRALDMLDRLGADAVAAKVRRDLRARGETTVPSRRRATTRENPVGLTARQVDVLRLLDDGSTNGEIAEQLYLSAKTVDHHVSAILAKLGVANRRDAVRRAQELGVLD
jgi:DNA-binding CsgD family transcriptional regulator